MAGLYEIIAELRHENQTPAATRTLDLVTERLGETQDNLRQALARIPSTSVPFGGQPVLEELLARAEAEHVDNLTMGRSEAEMVAAREVVDVSQAGIGLILGGLAVISVVLVVLAAIYYIEMVNSTIH
ncbi:MAG: hypothetical protein J2P38_05585 [Candidatus Dormibacteraeota bacterium]|nr:hypothetical protein [Candidatus Dormibacteraeota bacterium]